MIRHFAPLDPAQFDEHFLSRKEILRATDFGAKLAFGASALEERGFFRTPTQDQDLGSPSAPPLLTWPFLDFVEAIDLGKRKLLELGSGNSTVWFSSRFPQVRSFETDPEWHESVSRVVGNNVALSLVEVATLENADFEYRDEEWILVDFAGKRTKFLHHFFEKRRGEKTRPEVVVLDNSDWFRRGAAILQANGYREIPFYGFKSAQTWISCTSVFIDPARCELSPREPFFQPPFSRRSVNRWDSAE
jgi:hypothetical protein